MSFIRRPLVVGNWKMNGVRSDSASRVTALLEELPDQESMPFDLVVCPPSTLLEMVSKLIGVSNILLGGQDCHSESSGAHTGDISSEMLYDMGCTYVIIGHSERRANHRETDQIVHSKAVAATRTNLTSIICVGETKEQRDKGLTEEVIVKQISFSIPTDSTYSNIVIAYEPVWAIGTGDVPSTLDIERIHSLIRNKLSIMFGLDSAERTRIIYGGSVNSGNAKELLSLDGVDGALVGGASLNSKEFWRIAKFVSD